ncbi:SIR2 family protein [Streptomyces sp. 3214.6]|uniref:SIR2 family protein n=1 Tax=Streptomyces sp. 3214.6 TaxID=1882757 RepID=UPI00117C1302|nr:SIR2 family protein [Streptomyces sp. 3214.6]
MPGIPDSMGLLVRGIAECRRPVAVLAGAGVSASAGVSTGQELLRGIAARHGEVIDGDPVAWYLGRHGAFPNYIRMLQSEGDVSHDTLALPTSHFDRQPDGGPTRPTPAHRALASLVAAGHLRGPVLTTNFDRLLETALGEAGVRVEVALELEGIAAATQRLAADETLAHVCELVKLHGDYLDIRIRDTSCGFATYHPVIETFLQTVLDHCDLLVCGWSASWDIPLRQALERTAHPGRRTFWLQCGPPTDPALRVMRARAALVVPVTESDAGLTELARLAAPAQPPGRPT